MIKKPKVHRVLSLHGKAGANRMLKRIPRIMFGKDRVLTLIPGVITTVFVMLVAAFASKYLGVFFKSQLNLYHTPVSTFLLAIVLGMLARNVIKFPLMFELGFRFCLAKLLRLGIIFLGIRLSVLSIARIGLVAVVVVVICIASGIFITSLITRVFGVSRRLGTLIAAGTTICGVSAIVAISPTIGAKEEETAYAISTITIFGLLATLSYPYLAELVLGLNLGQAGIFLGTAVHDTSQVTAAAFIYDQVWNREVSQIAITTKLVRNTFMILVIPILSIMYAKHRKNETQSKGEQSVTKINLLELFPSFVLGFLAFSIFRSIGDLFITGESGRFLFWSSTESWSSFYTTIRQTSTYLLAIAIAGAGLSTQFSKLKNLTFKPFLIGLIVSVVVGFVSYILVQLLQKPINVLLPG